MTMTNPTERESDAQFLERMRTRTDIWLVFVLPEDFKRLFYLAESTMKEAWQPIETMPTGDDLFLAATEDGRIMIWRGSILARNLKGPTPDHLSFPAVAWQPLPALNQPKEPSDD